MSGLSEHDRAALRLIEERLAQEDPRLTRLLVRFGERGRPPRLPSRGWLLVYLVGLGCLLTIGLLAIFVR